MRRFGNRVRRRSQSGCDVIIERCHRCAGDPTCERQVDNACLPVPFFGDISNVHLKVVTIGLNPALNEYREKGLPKNHSQRLAMLSDYACDDRERLADADIEDARFRRENYFRNENRDWHQYFEKMEFVINRANPAWTYLTGSAAHLDIVACATNSRWSDLTTQCQNRLIHNCRDYFSQAINSLPGETVLLCDGARVIQEIKNLGLQLELHPNQAISFHERTGCHYGVVGRLLIDGKILQIRGWSSYVSRLSAYWRIDLARWLGGTII